MVLYEIIKYSNDIVDEARKLQKEKGTKRNYSKK